MSKNVITFVVVTLLLVVGGWLLTRPKQTMAPSEVAQPTQTPASTQSAAPSASSLVTITASGFSPKSITVKLGDTITWTNSDNASHTVNSDPHPTHTLYPFLNLGQITSGKKKSVTISKIGTYTYHDHLNPSLTGAIAVE